MTRILASPSHYTLSDRELKHTFFFHFTSVLPAPHHVWGAIRVVQVVTWFHTEKINLIQLKLRRNNPVPYLCGIATVHHPTIFIRLSITYFGERSSRSSHQNGRANANKTVAETRYMCNALAQHTNTSATASKWIEHVETNISVRSDDHTLLLFLYKSLDSEIRKCYGPRSSNRNIPFSVFIFIRNCELEANDSGWRCVNVLNMVCFECRTKVN